MDAENLLIEIAADGPDGTVVRVSGEVDIATSTRLERAFEAQLDREPPPRISADLERVGFMDTSGVAVLLAIRSRALAPAHAGAFAAPLRRG
jgi:anti-anti-sigma factor